MPSAEDSRLGMTNSRWSPLPGGYQMGGVGLSGTMRGLDRCFELPVLGKWQMGVALGATKGNGRNSDFGE